MPNSKTRLNVIIVDDEKEACKNLSSILLEYVDPDIHISGIAHNTTEAELLIQEKKPDAIFLDIEMPNENAFHFLERIYPFPFEIIFVTSYDEYAIRAFKLNAVDYILKPISIPELSNAVQKLNEKLKYKHLLDVSQVYDTLSHDVNNGLRTNKITLRDNQQIEIVDFKNICYLEAMGSYCKVVFLINDVEKQIVLSHAISEYEELLPDDMFYRIHKSYLVNCRRIQKVMKEDNPYLLMKNNATLPIGRRRFSSFISFLKSNQFYDA
ncbi:MAG: LytTR family DNA-binding domain-containing protein [Bacteroidota bacterium]